MLDQRILEMQDEIIEAVRASVMIKSVESEKKENMPFGEGVQKALEHALELAKKLSFKTTNLDNMIGYAEYGEGEEMIAVLGHLDVVPEGDGWTYPPYGAEIHEGKIYGRGTMDDKGPIIGALFALKAIKDLELPLKRRVRIIFGTNEESGSKGVKYYVERDEIPVAGFTPDAEYPIINAEKGIMTCTVRKGFSSPKGNTALVSIAGGTAPNVVPDYAEAVIWCNSRAEVDSLKKQLERDKVFVEVENNGLNYHVKIKVWGVAAHGSTPELGRNAISELIYPLSKLDLEPEIKEFLNFMQRYIGHETDGQSLGIALGDEVSGQLTCNLGTIQGNSDEINFTLNIRYPVTKKAADLMEKLKDKMAGGGCTIENIRDKEPLYMSPDEELIQKLQKVYEEKTGDEARLLAIGGGTYAKAMPNVVAFGPIFPGEPDPIHQPDEYITIANLIKNIQIMAAAIYELAS